MDRTEQSSQAGAHHAETSCIPFGAGERPGDARERSQQNRAATESWDEASSLILEAAGEGIYGLDADGMTTFANPAAEAMTGWKAEELVGRPQHALVHHSHADGSAYPREDCPIYLALRDGRVHRADNEVFWRKNGTSFPVAYTSTPILRDGRPIGAVVLFQDISQRKRREQWEKAKNAMFLAITGHRELEETLGMGANALLEFYPGCPVAIFVRERGRLRLKAEAGLPDELRSAFAASLPGPDASICARAAERGAKLLAWRNTGELNGAEIEFTKSRFASCLTRPLLSGSGEMLGSIATFSEKERDFADRAGSGSESNLSDLVRLAIEHKQLHAELVRQSQHDHLTGLPNRLLLEDRLEQAIARAKRHGTQVGVCYIDLDRFKQINDTLGHSVGDALLQHIADVLKRGVREIDTVARQGGDEFILVLPELSGTAEAEEICERLLRSLREPVCLGKHTVAPAASIGFSLFPEMGESATALLRKADTALYAAKRGGKGRVHAYHPVLGEKVHRAMELQGALRTALERNEFSLVYQPLYSMGKQLKGFEALLRWNPAQGPVGPDEFIPLAEEAGLIVPIGEWVLREACRQAVEWNRCAAAPVRMFVNVSAVQLGQPEFPDTVARVLAENNLEPRLLELEVTETSVIADPEASRARLEKLRALGVGISIDDFGTGYSSFGYLQQLPVNTLKIDRSFISRLDGSSIGSAIVRTIVALAEELGLETVAEGVETGAQMEELENVRCGLIQGYLLAKPLVAGAAGLLVGSVPAIAD